MKLTTVAGHTFDADRLVGLTVLDAGCRGFEFANWFRTRGHEVLPLDPDPEVWTSGCAAGWEKSRTLGEVALSSAVRPMSYVGAGEGGHLVEYAGESRVKLVTIGELARSHGPFDVVKLDIEGSEYGVLLDWGAPYARQITVEFHEHMGWGRSVHGEDVYDRIETSLGKWYTPLWKSEDLLDCLWVLR